MRSIAFKGLLGRFLARFGREDAGVMTILAVIFFVMILCVAGLVIDLGRLYNLHTQMQSYVDSVALATAAELDGNSGALNRAASAAVGNVGGVAGGPLVTGKGSLTAGQTPFSIKKIEFFSAIASDPAPPAIASAGDTLVATYQNGALALAGGLTMATANIRAKYVQVTATPMTLTYFMLPLASAILPVTMPSTQAIALQAMAGFKRELCNNAPIAMCNPDEPGEYNPTPGQELILSEKPDSSNYGYGVLCPNGNTCRDMLGERNPNTQCVSQYLPGKPGITNGPVDVGLNTRFDMYDPPYDPKQEGKDPEYAPALNTVRGYIDNATTQCSSNKKNDQSDKIPLPDDSCWAQGGGSCPTYPVTNLKHGMGDWDRNAYWTANHNGVAQPSGYATMTRYQVYLTEIAYAVDQIKTGTETSAPNCSKANATMKPGEDRRVLIVPIVNCGPGSDSQKIIAVGKYFMLQPVNTIWGNGATSPISYYNAGNNAMLRVEVIGRVDANAPDGVLKEYPTLYR